MRITNHEEATLDQYNKAMGMLTGEACTLDQYNKAMGMLTDEACI